MDRASSWCLFLATRFTIVICKFSPLSSLGQVIRCLHSAGCYLYSTVLSFSAKMRTDIIYFIFTAEMREMGEFPCGKLILIVESYIIKSLYYYINKLQMCYTRWQCATMQDRKIQYSTVQYATIQNNKIAHITQNNTQHSRQPSIRQITRRHQWRRLCVCGPKTL